MCLGHLAGHLSSPISLGLMFADNRLIVGVIYSLLQHVLNATLLPYTPIDMHMHIVGLSVWLLPVSFHPTLPQ